ncbi:MAG: response regulator [bacterium]
MSIIPVGPKIGPQQISGPVTTANPGKAVHAMYRKAGRPEQILRVAVVDDYADLLEIATIMLKMKGFEPTDFDANNLSREDLLFGLLNGNFDLIICDGEMPVIRGDEVVSYLRENGYSGYILANSAKEDSQRAMMEAGADHKIPRKENFYQFLEKEFCV